MTGASQYHGFLPVLVRSCISSLTKQNPVNKVSSGEKGETQTEIATSDKFDSSSDDKSESDDELSDKNVDSNDVELPLEANADQNSYFPLSLATALFSFLYHLASYDSGGEALVSCGMMESLLQVINWHGEELEHITVS